MHSADGSRDIVNRGRRRDRVIADGEVPAIRYAAEGSARGKVVIAI